MTKNILITGPTNGIGRETALALAQQGHKLFLLCRNESLGQALCDELVLLPGALVPVLLVADLGNMKQIRSAAEQFLALNEPLHVLINNAGVMNTSRIALDVNGTEQEQMFTVNHLAHFLLTSLLLPKLKETGKSSGNPSRIVVVASDAHAMFCKDMGFDDLSRKNSFSGMKVYAQSKLANILMTLELSKRLNKDEVIVNCLHPGAVASNFGKNNGNNIFINFLMMIVHLFFISSKKGAETSIWLATESLDKVGTQGMYYYRCKLHRPKPWGRDEKAAKKLWEISEDLLKITFS